MKYTGNEKINSFKIRWFIENCCEIKLSNGKTIVIDPMLVKETNEQSSHWEKEFCSGFGVDDLEGCDYVVLTHIHGDHITSLKEVYEKFHPSAILVDACSAYPLAKYLDIAPGAFIPVYPETEFNLGNGVKVMSLPGRHTIPIALIPYSEADLYGPEEVDREMGTIGSLYNSNYILTLPGNYRIAIDNGLYEPELSTIENYRPNFILKHKEKTEETHVGYFVDEVKRSGAEYIMSLCQQGMKDTIAPYTERINEKLDELGIRARAINPEPGRWYTVSLSLDVD